jgi:hypothetical protein
MPTISFGLSGAGTATRNVRKVLFSFNACSPSWAAATRALPLNGSRLASAERTANFRRDFAELVFLRFAEVCFLGFGIQRYEDDDLVLCKIKVNDPGTPALADACAWEGHAGLPKTTCAPNEGSLFGIGNKLVLKNSVVVIG